MNKKVLFACLILLAFLFCVSQTYASFYNYCYFRIKIINSIHEPVHYDKNGFISKKYTFRIESVDKCIGRGANEYCKSYNNSIKTKSLLFNHNNKSLNIISGTVLSIKLTIDPYHSEKWEVFIKK